MMTDWTPLLFGLALILLLVVVLAMRQFVSLRLAHRSIRDPETGVYTAEFIQEVYESELRRADRTGVPFSVAMIAPRRPSNEGGAAAPGGGPSWVARWLLHQLRGSDYLGRLQDNHFVAILPETWEDDAQQVGARILSGAQVNARGGKPPAYDVGVATWRPEQTDVWRMAETQLSQTAAQPR